MNSRPVRAIHDLSCSAVSGSCTHDCKHRWSDNQDQIAAPSKRPDRCSSTDRAWEIHQPRERNPDLPSCRAGLWPDHHSRHRHHRAGKGRRNTSSRHHPLARQSIRVAPALQSLLMPRLGSSLLLWCEPRRHWRLLSGSGPGGMISGVITVVTGRCLLRSESRAGPPVTQGSNTKLDRAGRRRSTSRVMPAKAQWDLMTKAR